MERRLISRVDVGQTDGTMAGTVLIYDAGNKISVVVTSRENGDAELLLGCDETRRVAAELVKAVDHLAGAS